MADPSAKSFTPILEYLHLALRYIASGFVAVGVYIFLYKPCFEEFKDLSAFLVFITATIGIITYGLHFATLDKVFYGWSIIHYLKKNQCFIPAILKTQIIDWQNAKKNGGFLESDILKYLDKEYALKMPENKAARAIVRVLLPSKKLRKFLRDKPFFRIKTNNRIKRYLLFALASQTYLRNISNDESLVKLQSHVEKRLALLNFLYCSFYQIVVITLYFTINKLFPVYSLSEPEKVKIALLAIFAFLLIYSAIRFNRRICSREMWLVENYSQKVEKGTTAEHAGAAT